jgi:hypothetical protein
LVEGAIRARQLHLGIDFVFYQATICISHCVRERVESDGEKVSKEPLREVRSSCLKTMGFPFPPIPKPPALAGGFA